MGAVEKDTLKQDPEPESEPKLYPPLPVPSDIAEEMAAVGGIFSLPESMRFAIGQLFDLGGIAIGKVTGEITREEFMALVDSASIGDFRPVVTRPFPPDTKFYALSVD